MGGEIEEIAFVAVNNRAPSSKFSVRDLEMLLQAESSYGRNIDWILLMIDSTKLCRPYPTAPAIIMARSKIDIDSSAVCASKASNDLSIQESV